MNVMITETPKEISKQLKAWTAEGFKVIQADDLEKGQRGFFVFKDEEEYNPRWDIYNKPLDSNIVRVDSLEEVIDFWNSNKDDIIRCNSPRELLCGIAAPDLENSKMNVIRWHLLKMREWKDSMPQDILDLFNNQI